MQIKLRARRVTATLLAVLAFLTLAHLAGKVLDVRFDHSFVLSIFELDGEHSIPRFFASGILLLSALLLFAVACATKQARGYGQLYWLGLALIFCYLAIDKNVAIHEALASSLRLRLGLSKLEFYAWSYGIVAVLLPLVYFRVLIMLPRQTTRLFVLGGVLFLFGAFGLDLVVAYLGQTINRAGAVYIGLATLEEVLEMGGVIVFIYALLSYLASAFTDYCFKVVA
jgi:hypothetical protein